MIAVALSAVDIDVTHAEATSFEFVIALYRMTLICCPAVIVDRHSLGVPSG